MRLPFYFGPDDIRKLDAKMFNQYIGLLYQFWNDHDTGSLVWDNVNVNSISFSTSIKTSNYTASLSDTVLFIDSSGGSFTITLPTAVGIKGKIYIFIVTAGNKVVTISPNGSETINGGTSFGLPTQYTTVQLISDGSNWFIV